MGWNMNRTCLNATARLIIWSIALWFIYETIKMHRPYTINAIGLEPYRIAHAGGGINSDTYTNSYEALNHGIESGFSYFEIDFVYTKDNQLVCLHDWEKSFYKNYGYIPSERLIFKEFLTLSKTVGKYTNCTLQGLSKWMTAHPNSVLISDVKGNNISALKDIFNVIPDAAQRVIPQIYNPKNFSVVKKIGFDSVIWTLYRYKGSDQSVIYWLSQFDGKVAVTMPKYRAQKGLGHELKKLNITSYVHTINSETEMELYKSKYNITEIYTDFILPNN